MNIDWGVINKHAQINQHSCIPSAVEMILKLLGKVGVDYYEQQKGWGNNAMGDFRPFDGKTIEGVTFKIEFNDKEYPRGSDFPLDRLFEFIDSELDEGRYVIISLPSFLKSNIGFLLGGFHMWIIYGKEDSDYLAFSKVNTSQSDPVAKTTAIINQVKYLVRAIQGTDILTYKFEE